MLFIDSYRVFSIFVFFLRSISQPIIFFLSMNCELSHHNHIKSHHHLLPTQSDDIPKRMMKKETHDKTQPTNAQSKTHTHTILLQIDVDKSK